MKPEGEKRTMEQAEVPQDLMAAIDGEFDPITQEDQWAETVSQKAMELLERAQTPDDFQKVLDQVIQGVSKSKNLGLVLYGGETTPEEVCAPVYKKLLLKMAQRYRFTKKDE
tara:strand:+ start:560 stop:895 length:336 start_codon:yes stop_codon:yes gene_type:complete